MWVNTAVLVGNKIDPGTPDRKNEQVLLDAIADGVGKDLCSWEENFAYANGFDEVTGKYLGLTAGQPITPLLGARSLGEATSPGSHRNFSSSDFLIKPEVASAQFKAEQEERQKLEYASSGNNGNGKTAQTTTSSYIIDPGSASTNDTELTTKFHKVTVIEPLPSKQRFYGSVELDSERINRDASQIADEILQHLISLVGAKVKVTLEIEAEVENGIPENVVRTIRENCHTLKFNSQDFAEG